MNRLTAVFTTAFAATFPFVAVSENGSTTYTQTLTEHEAAQTIPADADSKTYGQTLRRVVDLRIGEPTEVLLSDGNRVSLKLHDVFEARDAMPCSLYKIPMKPKSKGLFDEPSIST